VYFNNSIFPIGNHLDKYRLHSKWVRVSL